MKGYLSVALLFCCSFSAAAQVRNGSGITARISHGYIVAHHEDMKMMEAPSTGIELAYTSMSTGYRNLDSLSKHMRWEAGMMFWALGKPEINGQVIGVFGGFNGTLRKRKNSITTARLASGVGYFTRPFRISNNLQNIAIGSRFNGLMQAMLLHSMHFGSKLNILAGFGLTHYSNGNFTKPNLGINMPVFTVGADYFLRPQNTRALTRNNTFHSTVNGKWAIAYSIGSRQVTIADPRKFLLHALSFHRNFRHSEIRTWRAGVNVFIDRTYPYVQFQPQTAHVWKLTEITELAVFGGHEYRLGRLGFIVDLGIYLYRPADIKRRYYEAVGFRYFAKPNLYFQNLLKAHTTSADFFEWGVGLQF